MPLTLNVELTIIVLFALTFVGAIYQYNWREKVLSRQAYKLPPGPPGVPFFGNLFQVPALRPYPKFREWAKEYGAVYRLRLGTQDLIVLNTAEAADELFVNRGRTFSSRSPPHVAHDIMSAGQRMVFLPYDKEWKTARQSLQNAIGPGPSKKLRPIQDMESCVLIHDLLAHGDLGLQDSAPGPNGEVPEDHWFSLIRRYTTSIVMTVMYGQRVNRIIDNHRLHKIYAVLENFAKVGQPGNYLYANEKNIIIISDLESYRADAFPILRLLPDFLAPWRTDARKMHLWEMELWGGLLSDLQRDLETSQPKRESYISSYLIQRVDAGHPLLLPGLGITSDGYLKDTLLAYTAATVLEAGSDTTASVMQSFVLFMLSHPHVLEKAQEEVDRVVGEERMPAFEDEQAMPYLVACVKETMRRHPPTIMGIPHSADNDEVYNGYFIPKGSTVIGNVWAIHMDPARFPNPTAFQPERFLDRANPTRWGSGPDQDRDHYVFGWGRRFCQGTHIAEASLFIVLARLIWAVDFYAPRDPMTGTLVIPDMADEEAAWSEGFVSVPRTFRVGFRPRSETRRIIVERTFEDTQREWSSKGFEA
ncbi:cytochrome P450 [Lyophyllum atratum]|nr:cytochrome P450 [Lyophyllum atratum]